MLYIINKEIFFCDNDGTVWTGEKNESTLINLTATTNRLLAYLLERQGIVSSREDILEKVWLSYGLRSSNHSLNKYVADLRKMFTSFGLNIEVIVTVPTVGFMFTREVEVERNDQDTDVFPTIPFTSDIQPPNTDPTSQTKTTLGVRGRNLIMIAGIIFLGLLPAFLPIQIINLNLFRKYNYPQDKTYLLAELNDCKIFTLTQSSNEMTVTKTRIAKKLINARNLHCLDKTVFYFQPSDPLVYGYTDRVFLARCTLNKDNEAKFAACKNYYNKSYNYEN